MSRLVIANDVLGWRRPKRGECQWCFEFRNRSRPRVARLEASNGLTVWRICNGCRREFRAIGWKFKAIKKAKERKKKG